MTLRQKNDVLLYEEVFRLLEESDDALQPVEPMERRAALRSDYKGWQLIAPYRDGKRPRQHEFRFIECCDLSAGGFSFVAPDWEPCERFVIALGSAPFRFFVAQVVNRRTDDKSGQGRAIIGCRFLRAFL